MRREGYLLINITTLKATHPIIKRILFNSHINILKIISYINVYVEMHLCMCLYQCGYVHEYVQSCVKVHVTSMYKLPSYQLI